MGRFGSRCADGRSRLAVIRRGLRLLGGAIAVSVALSLGAAAGDARPLTAGDSVSIQMLAINSSQPGYDVLIPNFERVYPNIKLAVTYAPGNSYAQLETVELAAGNGPDLLVTFPGCGTPVSVCALGKSGDLAAMTNKPWNKRSLPLVTSLDKVGQGLFAFEPTVTPEGIFVNDGLFQKLGLKVPQTFSQLLQVCQKAKADGTVAMLLPGATPMLVSLLIADMAVAPVYAKDKHWAAEQRAGKVTFDGSAGWRQTLQEFVDMNNAGCFQPGATGTSSTAAFAEFAQGQSLMVPALSGQKGVVDASDPQFTYTAHPFPGGTNPSQTTTFLNLSPALSVNAHASSGNQAAAQTFVDFMARPKQDALFAELNGSLTQDEFLKGQIPDFMSSFKTVFSTREYVINPTQSWWNANVLLAMENSQIGLITGQSSIDDVLNGMDAAWKQGPS